MASSGLAKSAELNSLLLAPVKNHEETISRQVSKSNCTGVALGIYVVLDLAWFILAYLFAYSFSPVQILEVDIKEYSATSLVDAAALNIIRFLVLFIGCLSCAKGSPGLISCMRSISDISLVLMFGKLLAISWGQEQRELGVAGAVIGSLVFNFIECAAVRGHGANLTRLATLKQRALDEEEGEDEEEEKTPMGCCQMMQILRPYFWPRGCGNKVRAFGTYFLMGASKVCSVLAPLYIGYASSKLAAKGSSSKLREVFVDIAMYTGLSVSSKILRELQNCVYLGVMQTAFSEISESTFRHLLGLSLDWHLNKSMGTVLRAMDRGITSANNMVKYVFLYLGPSLIQSLVVFGIFIFKFQSPYLSVIAYFSLVLYIVATIGLTVWRKKFRQKTNKHDNDYHDRATDCLVNISSVKFFANEQFEIDRFCESIDQYQKYSVSTQISLSVLNATQQLILQACMAGCLMVAAWTAIQSASGDTTIDVGNFVTVNVYIIQLFQPLNFLGTIYGTVIQSMVDMQNLSELLTVKPDVVDPRDAKQLSMQPNQGPNAVEFRDVRFTYPRNKGTAGLHGVSFKIARGTTTAIVGPTGAGKSTIARLLFRFYDIAGGVIRVNGQDISQVTQHSLRKVIGVVPQDTVLFNNSLLYNLRYALHEGTEECSEAAPVEFYCVNPAPYHSSPVTQPGDDDDTGDMGGVVVGNVVQAVEILPGWVRVLVTDDATDAPPQSKWLPMEIRDHEADEQPANGKETTTATLVRERVRSACRQAQILDFIESLPKGWDTPVGERGLRLSGGEKQRVSIARALLKDPAIVVLDEATSSLDSVTEASVQQAIDELGKDRTQLVIAHRLSTIRDAQQILVLQGGRIAEAGTHAELLRPDAVGVYRELWHTQLMEDRQNRAYEGEAKVETETDDGADESHAAAAAAATATKKCPYHVS